MPRAAFKVLIRAILPLFLAAAAAACVKVDEDKAPFTGGTAATIQQNAGAGIAIEETADEYDPHRRSALAGGGNNAVVGAGEAAGETGELPPDPPALFLGPEQMTQNLKRAFNYSQGWTDDAGAFHDSILDNYRTLLGGVDFESVSVRDRSPKVNTLLVVRNLAYEIANGIVSRAAYEDTPDTSVFSKCDVRTDRPYDEADDLEDESYRAKRMAAERRWRAQLEDIYWRAYARAPSRAEVAAVRSAFSKYGRDWPPEGWVLTLYAILSTAEFWNL